MSSQLTWQLIKKNNAFLVKRNGAQFSRDPYNLTNKNTYSSSGLANSRAVDVSLNDGKVILTTKIGSKSQKPAGLGNKTKLGLNCLRVGKCIKSQTTGNNYRADLASAALARWTALNRSLRVDTSTPLKPKQRRGRRA